MKSADQGHATELPPGFVPYAEGSPFLERVGPLFERMADGVLTIGFRIATHHCNRGGSVHGGCIATLADITLGKTIARQSDPPISGRTISLNIDLLESAGEGEWITACADHWRIGRSMANAHVYIRSGAKIVARASGIFTVRERTRSA